MEKLREKNLEFIKEIKKEDPSYFDRLKEGQSPEYFVIACSDSRVCPSVITQMPLGNLFIQRNIANQVNENDESLTASLYYALKHLKVEKIIIKGHTGCGGVKAAAEGNDEPELKDWIDSIQSSLPAEKTDHSLDDLAKVNVLAQVEKLKQHPTYIKHGKGVPVIGCMFHVETGELEELETVGASAGDVEETI
ncbi:carbonic anhydrase [Bacillus sp. FJAT-44742]|uniref:carbonic anhydrase n=1 Tax=Bacillus sp. FJAT-44742 TaxID=2014005 RepID=UPI000C24712A|nr:carbonic anhydrase [Bacillus sp. FJAT-44742]